MEVYDKIIASDCEYDGLVHSGATGGSSELAERFLFECRCWEEKGSLYEGARPQPSTG